MWNLKYDTNDPIYETEIKSQTESSGLQQWEKGGGMGVSGLAEMQTRTFRKDKQQGPTI